MTTNMPTKQNEIFKEGLIIEKSAIRTPRLASTFQLIEQLEDANSDLVTRVMNSSNPR